MCLGLPVNQAPKWEERPLAVKLAGTKDLLGRIVNSFSSDCMNMLAAVADIGGPPNRAGQSPQPVTRDSLKAAFAKMDPRIIGSGQNPLVSDLWRNTSAATYADAVRRLGDRTLADVLDLQGRQAAAEYYSSAVYVTPGSNSATVNELAALLVHEALHLLGYGHAQGADFPFSYADIDDRCLKPQNITP
jgi:hypothetical protein